MRRKRFDFLEKEVLAVDLSEEQVILIPLKRRSGVVLFHNKYEIHILSTPV